MSTSPLLSTTARYLLAGGALMLVFLSLGWQEWRHLVDSRRTLAECSARRGVIMLVSELQVLERQAKVFHRVNLPRLQAMLRPQGQGPARAEFDAMLAEWFYHLHSASLFPAADCPARLGDFGPAACAEPGQLRVLIASDLAVGLRLPLADADGGLHMLLIRLTPERLAPLLRGLSLGGQRALLLPSDGPLHTPAGLLAWAEIPGTPWRLGLLAEEDYWHEQRQRVMRHVFINIALVLGGTLFLLWLHQQAQRLRAREDALEADNIRLYQQATHDALTGLYNRFAFYEHLDRLFRYGQRAGRSLAVLAIDIDRFKAINDTWGHAAGDRVLQRVAESIAASARRPLDMAARLGGEEFAVLLEGVDCENAWALGELLRLRVADLKLPHPHGGVVTVSVGVACSPPEQDCSPKELLARADRALYEAKGAGRNRVMTEWEGAA